MTDNPTAREHAESAANDNPKPISITDLAEMVGASEDDAAAAKRAREAGTR